MKLIVLFGAAVRADGRASPALARRVADAANAAKLYPESTIFCSGARGRHGPSEASVMAALLTQRGIAKARLELDEESHDTLTSVIAALRFMRARGLADMIICTDRYHAPRIRMMCALLGQRAALGPIGRWRARGNLGHWLWMHGREAVAFVYDFFVVLARRRQLLRLIAG